MYLGLDKRCRWIRISGYLMLACALLDLPGMLTDMRTGQIILFDIPSPIAFLQQMAVFTGYTIVISQIVFLVAFLMWTYRAAWNVRAFGAQNIPTTPRWAVLWYFIPIASLLRPYQALRDIWQASEQQDEWYKVALPGYFTLWWIASAIHSVIYYFDIQISNGHVSFEVFFHVGSFTLIQLPFLFLSVLLTIGVVNQVSALQAGQNTHKVFE